MNHKVYLIGCAIVAALGGFLFGFDTAVISGAETLFQEYFGLGPGWQGFTVTSALIGTILGAAVMGKPADWYGRRVGLFILALLFLISALGCAFAWNWWALVIFRFIGGLGVGGAAVVSPLYVAEISPAKHRGTLVAVFQFNIVIGILIAYVSNYLIGLVGFEPGIEWRWMFGVEAAPAALFGLLLLVTPESPRWLVRENRLTAARDVLTKIGPDTGEVETEIHEIEASLQQHRRGIKETLFQARYLKVVLLAVAIAAFNQLSGINAVLYYAPRIFQMTGAGEQTALLSSVGLGLINLLVTLGAMTVIDRIGRRKLMLAGSIGYIVSLAVVAVTFSVYASEFQAASEAYTAMQEAKAAGAAEALAQAKAQLQAAGAAVGAGGLIVLVGLLAFIASHAFGQGAVIWVFLSEIFPNEVRAAGQSVGVFTHWFMAMLISWLFPVMLSALTNAAPFYLFAGAMILQLLWVIFLMPETKGVPLERIQQKLGIREDRSPLPSGEG